jgi:hypothetical protein
MIDLIRALELARANAAMAADQRGAYDDAEESFFDNLRDSINEEGGAEWYVVRDAEDLYRAEFARLTR